HRRLLDLLHFPTRRSSDLNVFYMYYIDQLVATGQLNDVGGYIRTNSGKSFRTGVELQAEYGIIPQKLSVFGNLTYSFNQNIDYQDRKSTRLNSSHVKISYA